PGTTSTLKLRYLDESQIREVKILRETVTSKFSDFWIFDAYPDTKGAIWFAVRTGELIRYNGSSEAPAFERFDAKDGIDIVGRRPGTKLVESPDGLLWVVTSDTGGLNRFDGKSWSTSKLADLGGSDQNASIGVSPGGTLWVGGESTLHTYHGGQWTIYRAPESPIPDGRIIIHADKQNRLWIGGVGHGISNLDLGQDHFQTYQDLSFQFTAKDSTQWYLEKDGSPISFSGQWSRHSLLKEDFGLPIVGLVPAMNGGVLAVGDELGTVEIAKLDDGHWQKMTRVEITGSVNPPSITVLKDGGLWFGSEMAAYQYVGQKIKTYSTGFPVHAIGEDQDNTVWVSSQTNLYRLEGQALKQLANPDALSRTISQSILSTTNKDLWIGTEFFGLFQFSGESWIQHNIQNGLPSNNITDIVELPSGHIVISTNMGFSRYDGETWSDYLKDVPNAQRGGLRVETNGQLRINTTDGRTLRYIPKTRPPETMITVSIAKVSHPGNTVISWGGIAPWKAHSDQLMFSYRLDDTHWSTYASPTNKVLLSLPSGKHTFEVRARDTDFNVDPSPARLAFHVAPPIWREPWLVLTAIFLIIAGIFQTIRIVQRDRELQDKNEDLQIARTDLARRVKLRTQELMEANKKLILEVAEREKTERELIHLERLRAVGEMSAGISHNLNNMLTGILAPAQMVKSLMTDTEGQFYVDTILKSAERARDLIERLHNAVRGQRQDTLQPVHVNQVIHDAIQTARPRWKDEMESRGIEIELLTNLEPVPDIKATQSGLHDILVNLIFNAVDAMPKGGAITVATKESNNCVIISVRDTGVGMNEETKARVFEPFFTTKMNVGTGLGLFTVHGEINRWNGNIDITSMPEEGTTFTIELPTWVTPRIEAEVKEISHKHSAMGNKILLVDDESIVRDVVVHELSKQHQIVAKINGISALESFAGQNYDIAIIDLGLPGIPGDILAKKIKEQDPAIVTILITGWMLEEDDPRLNPFDFRLQKPLDAGDLHRIVTLAAQLQETRQEALGT
ncbi:MAG: signal transduction histidine kinase, partial [Candidatus Latescibacterota bacterium]